MGISIRKTFDGVDIRGGFPWGRFLFGSVFIVVGLGVAYAAFTGELTTDSGEKAGPLFGILFGGVFGSAGAAIAFIRAGVRIDNRKRTATKWWGLFVPMFRTEHALDDLKEVHLCKEIRRSSNSNGGSSSKTVYPVRLITNDNDRTEISAPRNAIEARVLAEAVARAGELPMHNTAAGSSVRREPDQLDWSLREHLLHAGDPPAEPAAPASSTLHVQPQRDGYTVRIPPMGLKSGIIFLLPAPFMIAIPVLIMTHDGSPSRLFIVAMAVMFGVPMTGLLLWMVHRTVRRTELRLTPDELTITRRAPWWKSSRTLRCDDIEELAVDAAEHPLKALIAAGGVTAVTDTRIEQFGLGLDTDDLRYLAGLIEHTVCR